MESKHTPGPWGIDINSVGEYLISAGPIGTPVDYLAVITNRKRSKANARLIAAAPELLEALAFCVEALEVEAPIYRDHIAQARAAIAKAKGE
ncbi:MAG: hypothetical protein WC455_29190 [Dehalococcoidia bacterium]|jgi:hypothetical protein